MKLLSGFTGRFGARFVFLRVIVAVVLVIVAAAFLQVKPVYDDPEQPGADI
jgi:hypothetical protein